MVCCWCLHYYLIKHVLTAVYGVLAKVFFGVRIKKNCCTNIEDQFNKPFSKYLLTMDLSGDW